MRNLDNLDVTTFAAMIIPEASNSSAAAGSDSRKVATNERSNYRKSLPPSTVHALHCCHWLKIFCLQEIKHENN